MSRTPSPSTGRPYGVQRVARVWEVARSSVYAAWRRATGPYPVPQKRGPKRGIVPDGELLERIRAVLAASPWFGEGHRKIGIGEGGKARPSPATPPDMRVRIRRFKRKPSETASARQDGRSRWKAGRNSARRERPSTCDGWPWLP
jgi:hypothetical protein